MKSFRMRELEEEVRNLRNKNEALTVQTQAITIATFVEVLPQVAKESDVAQHVEQNMNENQQQMDAKSKRAQKLYRGAIAIFIFSILASAVMIGFFYENGNSDENVLSYAFSPKLEAIKQKSILECGVLSVEKSDEWDILV